MLEINTSLKILKLDHNKIGRRGAHSIFQALRNKNQTLEYIDLDRNEEMNNRLFMSSHENVTYSIIEAIIDNHFIKTISLMGFHINSYCVERFVQALLINKLVRIYIYQNDFRSGRNDVGLAYIAYMNDRALIPKQKNVLLTLQWAEQTYRQDSIFYEAIHPPRTNEVIVMLG